MDLANLELRAVTLEPRRVADSVVIDVPDKEVLLIVKEGQVGVFLSSKVPQALKNTGTSAADYLVIQGQ